MRTGAEGALEQPGALLRRGVDRVSALVGYRPEPRDCRSLESDPLKALYRYGARGVVVDVPLDRCRTFGALGLPPTSEAGHPYVLAAEDYLHGRMSGYAGSALEAYYETVQPGTAADFLGLPKHGVGALGRMQAIEADLPWVGISGPHVREQRARFMESDSAAFGDPMGLEHGWSFIGPVSAEKGDLEIRRIHAIVDAIAHEGYQADAPTDHVWGYLLRDGSDYAAVIWGGQHRISALAALGYDSMPLLLYPHRLADRQSVDTWPAVRSGLITRDQALQIFDRLVAGRLPRHLEALWPNAWRQRASLSTRRRPVARRAAGA